VIRARKRFGQHFLEPAWVAKVLAAINPTGDEHFIEIGPGRGALTRPLAARAAGVVAVEIDRDLAGALRGSAPPNLTLIEGDFLDPGVRAKAARCVAAAGSPFRVAGNLPYNVASPILFSLVDLYVAGLPFTDASVMLQREVADRLLASPGTREYGAMTVLIGLNARVERLLNLPAGAFRPAPKVLSTVVRLRFHPAEPGIRDASVFRALVQAVFSRRRKTMANAVLAMPGNRALPQWLDGRRRPETLAIAEFARLADDFSR
jgi:16S rRNA (adenine1518-N6/adenine1519-N6)-dimethyltransferase